MRSLDVKDLGALVAWSTGQRVPEGSYGPVGQHPPDLARRTLSRMLLLVFERLDDLERSSVRADPATAATSGNKVPTRTSHDDLAREVSEWESGVRRPSGFREAPEAIPNRMASETTATIDEQDSTRCCLCSGPLDHQAMDNTAWPHLSQCKTCGATQSTGATSRQPHGGSRSADSAREALLLQVRMNEHDRAAIDRDREALLAWSTNKTIPDPDHTSPKWPNQITRGLARILLWACKRLDVDRVLIEGHENIVRNLSTRVEALEWGPPINTASLDHPDQVRNHEQRLQRLEECVRGTRALHPISPDSDVGDAPLITSVASVTSAPSMVHLSNDYITSLCGVKIDSHNTIHHDSSFVSCGHCRTIQKTVERPHINKAGRFQSDKTAAEVALYYPAFQSDKTAAEVALYYPAFIKYVALMEQLYGPPIQKAPACDGSHAAPPRRRVRIWRATARSTAGRLTRSCRA